jgi:predicted Zn finger-like uncharacterized protein
MIITCEKCRTRFNLDASLLDANGSTVRCSRCRHIFTAFPSPSEPEFNDLGLADTHVDKVPDFEGSDFAENEDPAEDVFQGMFEPEKLELEPTDPEETDTGSEKTETAEADELKNDEYGFEEFDGPDIKETDEEDTDTSETLSHEPPPPRRPARASLIQSPGQEEASIWRQDTPPKKRPRIGLPVLLLLILFLLAAGGYVGATFFGYKIPFLPDIQIPLIQKYLPEKTSEPISYLEPLPDQKSVTGRFLTNDTAGELFIITGKIENPSQIPYHRIQVKGTLFQKEKKAVMSQAAFCGNIIPEQTLKTAPVENLTAQLKIPRDETDVNGKLLPGGTIPFMLVFSDLPQNLENFTVEVAGFENATP